MDQDQLLRLEASLSQLQELVTTGAMTPTGLIGVVRWKPDGTGEVTGPMVLSRQPTAKASTASRKRLRGKRKKRDILAGLRELGLA